ncbi:hypothetical protein HGB13_02165 [bacterium]|nr:hypothetical protein [bacterium]
MGFEESKKIIIILLGLFMLGSIYIFYVEPVFIKKTETKVKDELIIPGIEVDSSFFKKIESLKNNTVTLDENSIVNNNPFAK